MPRFLLGPRWLLSHLFVLVLVVAMVNMGLWQLRRHDERAARNDLVEERASEDPVPLADVAVDDPRFVRVSETGVYDDDASVLIANRTLDGAPGFWVMTPLERSDAPPVLVARGFLNRATVVAGDPSAWAAGAGPVTVTGVLAESAGGGRFASGETIPQINRPDTGALTPPPAADLGVYIQAEGDPSPVLVPVPLPPLDGGSHVSYAVQWFVFTLIALIGYPLILRRVIRERGRTGPGTLVADDGVRS